VIGLIVGVITIILTLILIALFERGASSQVSVCHPEQRDHLRAVMLTAIDRAIDEQVGNLFATGYLMALVSPSEQTVRTMLSRHISLLELVPWHGPA
jgi:hypothetical protein